MDLAATLDKIDVTVRRPSSYRPKIALVGCNAITNAHLGAYQNAGYEVVAFCDLNLEMAKDKRDRFFPEAEIVQEFDALLERDDIDVLDLATMPSVRYGLMEKAIDAGKHILSQKPFVESVAAGEKLVEKAREKGVKLAVNQNARFAPFWLYLREVIRRDIIGDIVAIDFINDWDYKWIKNRPDHSGLENSIIYDFGIHWIDLVVDWMGGESGISASAFLTRAPGQTIDVPLHAKVLLQYPETLCSLAFFGNNLGVPHYATRITGTKGIAESAGANFSDQQQINICFGEETVTPEVEGGWFNDGLDGTMTELLLAIEEDREPSNSAANNLKTLRVLEAVLASTEKGQTFKI